MWRTQFQKSRRASNTCDEFCCYHALDARVVCGRLVGRREAASHAGMLARSPQIAAGESSRRQKPWARKLLASMRVTNVSVAAMQVTTSVNPTSLRAVMSPVGRLRFLKSRPVSIAL
jgi:hypothetical protein